MKINNATFITSVASADKLYKTNKPIIAVAGKSNVGKSSLINMLANQKKLAKTSVTPGRTRLINYFDFGEFILADLPGYGFAQVSKAEKAKWAKTLDQFFQDKEKRSEGICRRSAFWGLRLFLAIILQCPCQLVGAGGGLEAATDPAQALKDLVNR